MANENEFFYTNYYIDPLTLLYINFIIFKLGILEEPLYMKLIPLHIR